MAGFFNKVMNLWVSQEMLLVSQLFVVVHVNGARLRL
jgi:hypothetical protein